jgi:hypothetical protein
MEELPTNIGVFFGRVDKRSEGWYWTDAESPTKITGPFETKAQAAENARQSLGLSHQITSPGEMAANGTAGKGV